MANTVPVREFLLAGVTALVAAGMLPVCPVRGEAPPAAVGEVPVQLDLDAEMKAQFDQLRGEIGKRGWFDRVASQVYREAALILASDRDPADVVLRRTAALFDDLKQRPGCPDLSSCEKTLADLRARSAATDANDSKARYDLYTEACRLRRRLAFANPLLDFDRILFVKRHRSRTNHMCDQFFGFTAAQGGSVFVLSHPFSPEPKLRDVLAGAVCRGGRFDGTKLEAGSFISPALSYDGRTILFAYTEAEPQGYQWTPRTTYHVFRVNVDGSDLVQLTDGPVNDFDPCWMPNGRVVFISERRRGYGRCHGRPVPIFTLHTMTPDGGDIRCLSFHESNEWQPSVSNEGMILYTRWDYVDRGFSQAHHPWVTSPDGRDARAIHGNYPKSFTSRPWMELDVRAVPASHKLVATAAAHHSQAYGSLVLVDPDIEDDDAMAPVRRLTPDSVFPESEAGTPEMYATAWPLSQVHHLCVYDRGGNNYGVYLLDAFGNKELLYRDPQIAALSPMPLRPRAVPPVHPDQTVDASLPNEGTVALVSLYDSRNAWPEGTKIAALRIVQVLPKSTPNANEPRIGYGSQKGARAVLGTVPVEADGSAHFRVPAGKPVYFQALDARGRAVQSMRSDVYVRPGERLTCQGCHEHRHRAPQAPARVPMALRRGPSGIRPDVEGSNPFSFARLVQPVFDRHCVACHKEKKKGPDLANVGGGANGWLKSYERLRDYAFFFDGDGETSSRTIPGKFGALASRLYRQLDGSHHDVKLTPEELHRVALWLDCNSDFYGAYENTDAQARGEVVRPTIE